MYCWLIADDDLMAPGAFEVVMGHLQSENGIEQSIEGIIGRAKYFKDDPVGGLGDVVPPDFLWSSGEYGGLSEVGQATKGQARLGAFVFSTNLFRPGALDRYKGTSHAFFGGFWDGLANTRNPSVVVVEEPLVYLRADKKEWDESAVVSLLGRHHFEELLPREVREHLPTGAKELTRVKALRLAASTRFGERKYFRQLLEYYETFETGARVFSRLPGFCARLLLPLFRKSMVILDLVYRRVHRR